MSTPATLYLPESVQREVVMHGLRGIPHEICGFLVGRDSEAGRTVTRSIPADNVWPDVSERPHRFAIDPLTQLRLETALTDGESLLGFYHSHPTAPAIPSKFDRDVAWPFYSYLIVSLQAVEPAMRCWQCIDGQEFVEQSIHPIA